MERETGEGIPFVTDCQRPFQRVRRVRNALFRFAGWFPGLKQGAPKRNVVLLIIYAEVMLFVLALVRYLV